jgi:lipopolysaccharide assembly protein A
MRLIKLVVLTVILLAIVLIAIANRGDVTVQLLPEGLSHLMPGASVTLPLFVVILLGVVTGLVLGYLLEYLRETKHRRRAAQKSREAAALNREMDSLRREAKKPKDDVLALLGG